MQTRATVFGTGSRLDFCRLPGSDSSRHRRKSKDLRFWDIRPGPSCSKKVGHVFGNPEDSAHSGPAGMAKVELGPCPLRLRTTPTTCSPAYASRPWSPTRSPQEQTCGCDQNLISLLGSPDSQPRHSVRGLWWNLARQKPSVDPSDGHRDGAAGSWCSVCLSLWPALSYRSCWRRLD